MTKFNLSKIKNPKAQFFLKQYLRDREINYQFFKRVPGNKMDFRMVNTKERKSDSPKESLIHQIDTTRDYVNGIKTGVLKFGIIYVDLKFSLNKEQLLKKWDEAVGELITLLSDPAIDQKTVLVLWSQQPIPAIDSL